MHSAEQKRREYAIIKFLLDEVNNIDMNGTVMLMTKGTGSEKQHDLEAHLAVSGSFRGGYGQVISPINAVLSSLRPKLDCTMCSPKQLFYSCPSLFHLPFIIGLVALKWKCWIHFSY